MKHSATTSKLKRFIVLAASLAVFAQAAEARSLPGNGYCLDPLAPPNHWYQTNNFETWNEFLQRQEEKYRTANPLDPVDDLTGLRKKEEVENDYKQRAEKVDANLSKDHGSIGRFNVWLYPNTAKNGDFLRQATLTFLDDLDVKVHLNLDEHGRLMFGKSFLDLYSDRPVLNIFRDLTVAEKNAPPRQVIDAAVRVAMQTSYGHPSAHLLNASDPLHQAFQAADAYLFGHGFHTNLLIDVFDRQIISDRAQHHIHRHTSELSLKNKLAWLSYVSTNTDGLIVEPGTARLTPEAQAASDTFHNLKKADALSGGFWRGIVPGGEEFLKRAAGVEGTKPLATGDSKFPEWLKTLIDDLKKGCRRR